MTRVILTNKQTGQELPEAELVYGSSTALDIQFDGAARTNVFSCSEWDYREVRAFRNGDVLRRKDRKVGYAHFVYDEIEGWLRVNHINPNDVTVELPRVLNNPEWELV